MYLVVSSVHISFSNPYCKFQFLKKLVATLLTRFTSRIAETQSSAATSVVAENTSQKLSEKDRRVLRCCKYEVMSRMGDTCHAVTAHISDTLSDSIYSQTVVGSLMYKASNTCTFIRNRYSRCSCFPGIPVFSPEHHLS